MLWSPRLSLSNFHVKLTAKGLFRNLQLPTGCKKNTMVFHAVDKTKPRGVPVRTTTSAPGVSPQPSPDPSNPSPAGPATATETISRSGSALKPGLATRHQGLESGSERVRSQQTERKNQAKEERSQVEEKKNQVVNQLRKLLVQGNRRVEALATVIQHLFTEREEALRQKKELALELANLRNELSLSAQCCERLRQEKEEERVSLEERLRQLGEEQKEERERLEERLRSFYQEEWDKVHQAYQEEADRCRTLVEQQLEELKARQEAQRQEQEESHRTQIESLRKQYETSIQELKSCQQQDLDKLDSTLKETQASLSERISDLTRENEELKEKLRVEEERRRLLSDKTQKDAHTLYLEQELESLKVVLEMRNSQLHQQDKKLMQMDKLMESHVKLEECLNKVQQENEDYRARMDKHAALSRQLSSEQALLQQTLQKESKVNKRLSMENEELLWKLHNGDLASPRRLSPTSPFPSPRNSASFPSATTATATPLSPR